MRIEDEIKQKRFQSPQQKLNVNLVFTANWLVGRMQDLFKPHEITLQQYNILRILRGQYPNPCTIQLLKDRMLDKQSDVSRLVDRLTQKGIVERSICESDRRKMDVKISQKGLDLLTLIDPEMGKVDDVMQNLNLEEIDQLNSLLDKMRG
jgi:DNA-binding MarR family transcriptional regulator